MKEDELGEALRALPRAEPSVGFRRRVLNRVEEQRLGRFSWRPLYVAAALVALTSIPAGVLVKENRDASRDRQRVEQLRREYRSLERELLDLRSFAVRSTPLVAVQGTGEHDYVLDLRNLYAEPDRGPRPYTRDTSNARPASYRRTP